MRIVVLIALVFAASIAEADQPQRVVQVLVMQGGDYTIDGGPVLGVERFKAQMEPMLRQKPCVRINIRSGSDVPFEAVGHVIYLLQQSGCAKIGFLTEPRPIEPETAH